MTPAAIIAGLGSLATVIGGIVYIFKYSAWALKKTAAQKDQEILNQNRTDEQKARDEGRPV